MSEIWSVRGVSPSLRRGIVKAAEREGISVAEWLERQLADRLDGAAPPAQVAKAEPSLDGLLSKIDSCLADLQQLHRAEP